MKSVMSVRTNVTNLASAFVVFLMFSSCAEKNIGGGNHYEEAPISFEAEYYDVTLKGVEINTGNISSFGVFAALEATGDPFVSPDAVLVPFMDNVPVRKSGSLWLADPVHYWPVMQDKTLSFFAYAPYVDDSSLVAVTGWGPDREDGQNEKSVEITYTSNDNPSRHVDLCVARTVLDRTRLDKNGIEQPVCFDFVHTLSWVSFAANYVGELPAGCYLRVDEIDVNGVVNRNRLTYDSRNEDFFSWETLSASDSREGRFVLNIGSLTLASHAGLNKSDPSADKDTYTDFVTSNGVIYALPQEVNPVGAVAETSMDVVFSYVKEDASNAIIAQFSTSFVLPRSVWEVGHKYKYQFTLDVTTASLINVSCEELGEWIEPWDDSDNDHIDTIIK